MSVVEVAHGCLNGWRPKNGGCSYTGGCYCQRGIDHPGQCRCVCGSRATMLSADRLAPTSDDPEEER